MKTIENIIFLIESLSSKRAVQTVLRAEIKARKLEIEKLSREQDMLHRGLERFK